MSMDDWRCPKLSRVVHNINTARKLDKWTDVTFVVGADDDACIIKAHRVVLGTANDELAKLMSGLDMPLRIRMPDISPKGFKNLIRYLYDIDVKFSDLSAVRETHLVAEKFKVYKLKLATEIYLNQAVKYEPILEMLQIALDFKMTELQFKCMDMISAKYQDVLKSEELISASYEVMATVLSIRPCHGEGCQYQSLLAISKWKKKHEKDHRPHLVYLLGCVDFTRLRMADFNAFVEENDGLLSNDDIISFQKYMLSKDICDAPEWYKTGEAVLEDICDETNTEETANEDNLVRSLSQDDMERNFYFGNLERNFPLDIVETNFSLEQQKSKVKKAMAEEIGYVHTVMRETANISLENHNRAVNETVRIIIDYFSDAIKEAVETTMECFEDELSNEVGIKLRQTGISPQDREKEVMNTGISPRDREKEAINTGISPQDSKKEAMNTGISSQDSEKEAMNTGTKIVSASGIENLSKSECCDT